VIMTAITEGIGGIEREDTWTGGIGRNKQKILLTSKREYALCSRK
jgi:hypothetical protein